MNRQQRQHKLNLTAEAIFSGGITEDQYEAIRQAAQYRGCPVCPDSFPVAEGIRGDNGKLYCSQGCFEVAERESAPMIKPQPKGTVFEGWQI